MERLDKLPTPIPTHPGKVLDRLTVLVNVHHEHAGDQPMSVQHAYSEVLKTTEDHYTRRYSIGSEWKAVSIGHFMDDPSLVGVVIIQNLEGTNLQVRPTESEAKELEGRVVLASYSEKDDESDDIPPRGLLIKRPVDVRKLKIRTPSPSPVQIRVTIIPR